MIYIFFYFILPLLILYSIYGLAVFGLVVFFRKIEVSSKKRVALSFLTFGIVTGALVAWYWPYDIIVLINPITAVLGDIVYRSSIQYLGDPNSPQAHYTVPWIFRIPQVYVSVSTIFWGLMGLLIQLIYNWRRR